MGEEKTLHEMVEYSTQNAPAMELLNAQVTVVTAAWTAAEIPEPEAGHKNNLTGTSMAVVRDF